MQNSSGRSGFFKLGIKGSRIAHQNAAHGILAFLFMLDIVKAL